MKYQAVFRRYELKYILNSRQRDFILEKMSPYMHLDSYGKTSIRNLYFDTDQYRLIRRSIEGPTYKEKLRVRSYGSVDSSDDVFVELKKKYNKVVYKRRIILPERQAMEWLAGDADCPRPSQISAEIDYFLHYYGNLKPRVYLSYDREAYYACDQNDFRITFDQNIRVRQKELSLCSEPGGISLLDDDQILMEVKCSGGIPLWMTHALSEAKLYKTSFSKYGIAYQRVIYPQLKGECLYV